MTNIEARHRRGTGRARCAGASLKKGASQKKGRPKGKKAGKSKAKALPKKEARAGKNAKPARAKEAGTPRAASKGAKILELIGRPKGATLAEIVKATDWQKRSGASSRPPPRSTASRSSPRKPRQGIAYTKFGSRIPD